jgi:hypothetical protein
MVISRKALHVNVSEDVHAAFRKLCIDNRLTMQEVCEYFVTGLVDEDQAMLKILNEISKKKKDKTIRKISKTEFDSIYDAIGGE